MTSKRSTATELPSALVTDRAERRLPEQAAGYLFAGLWLLYFGLLQWSVVRFKVPIVLGLTVGCLALAWWQARRVRVAVDRAAVVLILVGSAVLLTVVPMFSYLTGGAQVAARGVLVVAALACAALVAAGSDRRPWTVPGVALTAAAAYAVTTAIAILADPAPRIDVWVTLQQAADGMLRGENMYAMTWVNSPGIQDAFTYLPWTAVLLAPGRWLVGDVRWMLLVWMLLALAGIWRLGRGRPVAAYAIAVLALAPGTLTQVDQAWTEPLLLAGLVWWAVLVDRGRAWWAVVPLALACASKQHLALLLPVLLLWRPFGVRRTLATGALTGLLVLPWFLAGPADFVHDTITLLVGFHPIRFANTWYLLFMHRFGVTLPFWVTGVVVLGTLAATLYAVARRQPPLAELLRWLALLLLVANLVNKQAFYNQFWLSAALVAASLAAQAGGVSRAEPPAAAAVRTSGRGSRPATGG